MIKLNFIIEPTLLAYEVVRNIRRRPLESKKFDGEPLSKLQMHAYRMDSDACDFWMSGLGESNIVEHNEAETVKNARKLLEEIVDDPLFKPVLAQSLEGLSLSREEWEQNYQKTAAIMSELTGISLDRDITVYMTHPLMANGSNYKGKIFWTYRLDFPNYNTIYLWHEIMHLFIRPENEKDNKGSAEHAVVQYLTDNELRVRLNGGSYPPFIGHDFLRSLETALLPAWREYLAQPHKDIYTFVKTAREVDSKLSVSKN